MTEDKRPHIVRPEDAANLDEIVSQVMANRTAAEEATLVERAKAVVIDVQREWNAWIKTQRDQSIVLNREAASLRLTNMLIERFRTWDKEEILFLVVLMHVEILLEQI